MLSKLNRLAKGHDSHFHLQVSSTQKKEYITEMQNHQHYFPTSSTKSSANTQFILCSQKSGPHENLPN